MKRRIFVVAVVAALLCCNITSFAAVKTMPDGTQFDAAFYAASNPDVVAAIGTDEATLYQHYVLFGKAEGRAPVGGSAAPAPAPAPATGPVPMPDGTLFDAAFYAATYPDVVAVFGTDPAALYQHYITAGAAEGRLPYAGAGAAPAPAPAPAPVPAAGGRIDTIAEIGHSIWIPNTYAAVPLTAQDRKENYVRYYTFGDCAIAVQYIPNMGINDPNVLYALLQNSSVVTEIEPIVINGEQMFLYDMPSQGTVGLDGLYNGGVVEVVFYPADDAMLDTYIAIISSYN